MNQVLYQLSYTNPIHCISYNQLLKFVVFESKLVIMFRLYGSSMISCGISNTYGVDSPELVLWVVCFTIAGIRVINFKLFCDISTIDNWFVISLIHISFSSNEAVFHSKFFEKVLYCWLVKKFALFIKNSLPSSKKLKLFKYIGLLRLINFCMLCLLPVNLFDSHILFLASIFVIPLPNSFFIAT